MYLYWFSILTYCMELKTWLDRSQKEISNNKGKCFKKEKEARYFHDNVLITTNSALLWSYARTEQYCEMIKRYMYILKILCTSICGGRW